MGGALITVSFHFSHCYCLFGCDEPNREDIITHYVFFVCSNLLPFVQRMNKDAFLALDQFLLLSHEDWDDTDLAQRALCVAAIYAAHNRARTAGLPQTRLLDFLHRTVLHLKRPVFP